MKGELINHFILLLLSIWYILVAKGVVKLPQASQERYDRQSVSRKKLWVLLACILIVIFIVLIIKDLQNG